jgi:hypothetical protein
MAPEHTRTEAIGNPHDGGWQPTRRRCSSGTGKYNGERKKKWDLVLRVLSEYFPLTRGSRVRV